VNHGPRLGLVLNEYSQQIGGMSTVARATVEYLHARGYELHLFTNRHCEPDPVIPTYPILTTDLARDLPRLARFKMDLWHSLNYGYAPLALRCRPLVVTVHGNDFLSPWVRFKFEKAPVLWRLARRERGRSWTQRFVDAVSLPRVDEVIAVSRFTANLFQETCHCERPPTVIPNGVEEFFLQEGETRHPLCNSPASRDCRPPSCPEGTQVCSQGRKPLVQIPPSQISPEGATEGLIRSGVPAAPLGLSSPCETAPRGSRPWLQTFAPAGAFRGGVAGESRPLRDAAGGSESVARHPNRLISVAALSGWQRKNVDGVTRAMAMVGDRLDLEYCIVGDGTGRPALEKLAMDLGVSHRVRFLGRLSQEELRETYASASLFVLAPRPTPGDVEGFGLVYLEAAGSGTPSLGTRFGGTTDAIAEGKSGFFADDASPEAIARALERFFTGQIRFDPETVRAHARRHAWPVVLRQVESIYARVCPQVREWIDSHNAMSDLSARSTLELEMASETSPALCG
jgi:glycosyltransferase involved in cell wall biosynthesis